MPMVQELSSNKLEIKSKKMLTDSNTLARVSRASSLVNNSEGSKKIVDSKNTTGWKSREQIWKLSPVRLLLTQSNNVSTEAFRDSACQSTHHLVKGLSQLSSEKAVSFFHFLLLTTGASTDNRAPIGANANHCREHLHEPYLVAYSNNGTVWVRY